MTFVIIKIIIVVSREIYDRQRKFHITFLSLVKKRMCFFQSHDFVFHSFLTICLLFIFHENHVDEKRHSSFSSQSLSLERARMPFRLFSSWHLIHAWHTLTTHSLETHQPVLVESFFRRTYQEDLFVFFHYKKVIMYSG